MGTLPRSKEVSRRECDEGPPSFVKQNFSDVVLGFLSVNRITGIQVFSFYTHIVKLGSFTVNQ